ncbi:MAG: O-antigen ligase family protein [Planctomycetes bacterium]|nr:O-antigen ligase family protein [Planctomycetota bacterium]
MPDLPVRFGPARIAKYKQRVFPSVRESRREDTSVAVGREEPTPRAAFFFLLLFIFFSYAQLAAWLPGHATQSSVAWLALKMRLSFTPALLALISIIWYKNSHGQEFLFTKPQMLLLVLLLGCALASVPFSVYPRRSLAFASSNVLKLLFLFVLTINVIRNTRSFKAFLWTVALSGCFPAVGALLANYFPDQFAFHKGASGRIGWTGHYGNANTVAAAMCMLIPVALCLAEVTASRAKKAVLWLLIMLYGFVMLKMLSRASMVSIVLIAIMYTLMSKHRVRNMAIAAILGAIAVAAVPSVISRAGTMSTISEDASAMGRFGLWKAGLKMGFDRPLWGVGVGCFDIAVAEHFSAYGEGKLLRWRPPHSSYIATFTEMGAPGLLVFLALIGVSMADARRLRKKLQHAPDPEARNLAKLARAVLLALVAVSAIGLTSDYAFDWSLHMFIALVVCLKQMGRRHGVYI